MTRRCVALLGGSFDPVHNGHIALARHFIDLLRPDELRIVPAGDPWQKHGLHASAEDRIAMVRYAFGNQPFPIPVTIDLQEIQRHTPTYTIETLKAVRAEVGPAASLLFLLGADQLQHLDSWHEWQTLLGYAHLCAAARPGFQIDGTSVPDIINDLFIRHAGTPEQLRYAAHGMTFRTPDLAVNISATQIRAAIRLGEQPESLVPAQVLDYIEQHHLYKS